MSRSAKKLSSTSTLTSVLSIALALVSLQACGKILGDAENDKNGEAGEFDLRDDGTPQHSSLATTWEGLIKSVQDPALSGRPPPEPVVTPIKIQFSTDDKFRLTTTDDKEGQAQGTYARFASSLLFKVEYSNISLFGMGGSTQEIPYVLIGNTLKIHSETMSMVLRTSAAISQGSIPIERTMGMPLAGAWQGTDQRNNEWKLFIEPDGLFNAKVAKKFDEILDNSLILHMTGRALDDAGNPRPEGQQRGETKSLNLLVQACNKPNILGASLRLEISDDGKTLSLSLTNPQGEETQEFELVRQ